MEATGASCLFGADESGAEVGRKCITIRTQEPGPLPQKDRSAEGMGTSMQPLGARRSAVSALCRIALAGAVVWLANSSARAQKPTAELPRVRLDTTWNEPKGGKRWAAHNSDELTVALNKSAPGDVIVLDAGATYTGGFQLPAKNNPQKKWTYIVSSAIAKLPEGKRVGPDDAANMPKLATPKTMPVFQVNGGANHWRLAGLEITTASTFVPQNRRTSNGYAYFLIGSQFNQSPLPDSFTIDRCYIHGTPTQDIVTAVQGNAANYAVIDSYISDIHAPGQDSQAIAAYDTPGPFKIANNHLEAAGENVMFGGSGQNFNRGVPSDIEIRNNYLYKPLAWAKPGVSIPPANTMVVKNAFECKSCQRLLFDNNVIENVWAAGQIGFAIVLTVRSGQSGDFTVINDITITNNVLKNVVSGFNTLAKDDRCGPVGHPQCKNAGSQDRWNISNNLILFYDPTQPGGKRNVGLAVNGGNDQINGVRGALRGVVFQHNTMVAAAGSPCWNSVYFSASGQKPPFSKLTNDIWILDNVLCKQPTGDGGQRGVNGLTQYMGASENSVGLDNRFYGNVMFLNDGDRPDKFPPHNLVSSKQPRWIDAGKGDYGLAEPKWTETTDGKPAGVDSSMLPKPPAGN